MDTVDSPKYCPLCMREAKRGSAKILYKHVVCSKCYYALANRRQLAFIIDRVAWGIGTLGFYVCVGIIIGLMHLKLTREQIRLIDLTAWPLFLFFLFKDGFSGYSLGKRMCGVQTIDRSTRKPVGFGASFKRNLPLFIPFMPLIVGGQLMKGNRTGDGWSNSMVIWTKYANSRVFGGVGTCERCEYDLFGNTSGICPECGTPVSVENKAILAQRQQESMTPVAAG